MSPTTSGGGINTPALSRNKGDAPRKQKPAPPTLDYLLKLREDAKRLYNTQDEQIKTMRQVRELLDPQPAEMGSWRIVSVEVRAPIATDNIQRTAATLSVNPPELQCKPAGQDKTAQENATKRERCTEAILDKAGQRESGPPAYQMAIDAAVADGGAWAKVVLTDDVWDEVYALTMDATDEEGNDLFEDDPDPPPKPDEKPEDYVRRIAAKMTKEKRYKAHRAELKRQKPLPIALIQVDAATIYPFYGGLGKIQQVLEVTRRPVTTTFRDYRLKRGRDGRILKAGARDGSPSDATFPEELGEAAGDDQTNEEGLGGHSIEFLEHWDDWYVTYAVLGRTADGGTTGVVVDQWEHGYSRQPYFFAPGIWMNHWKNRKVGWGVSESMRWLVQYLGFLLTVHANLAARDAFVPLQEEVDEMAAPILGERDRPRGGGVPEPERWRLGVIYKNGPGRRYSPITFPQVAEQLKEQIKLVMDLIEQLVTPRVASQIGGNMEGAGFAISQVLAEGRIRHDPIAQGIERMLRAITEFVWHLIKNVLKEDVWIYTNQGETSDWDSLGPDDLGKAVEIVWTVNAETPSAELLKARYWGERLANETASKDQAIEGMGDNPDEVRIGLAIDRIRKTPAYQAWEEAMVYSRADRGDIMTKIAGTMADQMIKTGVVPPSGANPANAPDVGALALSSNGAGARPIAGPMAAGPTGMGPGATNPQQAAMAQVQSMGGPGT